MIGQSKVVVTAKSQKRLAINHYLWPLGGLDGFTLAIKPGLPARIKPNGQIKSHQLLPAMAS